MIEKATNHRREPARATYWRLVAISLDPESSKPELYGVIYEGETDIPLMVNGRIALFADPLRAPELIRRYGEARVADDIDVAKPFFWCDIAKTLHLLSAGGIDDDATVVSALNVLLDLVKASGAKLDDRRRSALHAIADYCTTTKDITKYLEEDGDHSSDELVDAVLWCVGAIVVKSTIL